MTATTTIEASANKAGFDAKLARLQKRIAGRLEQGFYSTFQGYGLLRDLGQPLLERPKAKIPLSVRPLAPSDLDILLPESDDIPAAERQQIAWRRHFHKKIPHGCFVAVDERDGTPCYMQWLVSANDNDLLTRFKCFPRFKNDEALLEQAYTIPSHRGLGVMSAAMADIAEKASDYGARYVMTFVESDGFASLKACHRAGFNRDLLQKRFQIGYGTFVHNSFQKLKADDPRRTTPF